jgi:hypothetical protein
MQTIRELLIRLEVDGFIAFFDFAGAIAFEFLDRGVDDILRADCDIGSVQVIYSRPGFRYF